MRRIKPNVVEEVMDGELLAIDDTSGTYVAVRGAGVWLWGLLRDGVDVELIKGALEPALHAEVDSFLAGLETAGLLTDAEASPPTTDPTTLAPPNPWTTPQIDIHDDLQDLLLLDPIHEVTDAGWPNMGTAG